MRRAQSGTSGRERSRLAWAVEATRPWGRVEEDDQEDANGRVITGAGEV